MRLRVRFRASVEARAGSPQDRFGRGDLAVTHDHLAIGIGGDTGFVGDEDDRGPLLACRRRSSSSMTSSPVSESSEPVGSSANSTSGLGDETTGQRDALRLSAGHLAGAMTFQARRVRAVRTRSAASRRASSRRVPPRRSGSATFSSAVSSGTSWPNWKTKPKRSRRSLERSCFSRIVSRRWPSKKTSTGVWDEDAGQAVEQGRLARTARAHDGEDLAPLSRTSWRHEAPGSLRRRARGRAPRGSCPGQDCVRTVRPCS